MPRKWEGEGREEASSIDWSEFGEVHEWLTCSCGQRWRSHCKLLLNAENPSMWGPISKDPCPECGSHVRIMRAESDPETMML